MTGFIIYSIAIMVLLEVVILCLLNKIEKK